jgi:hypothetical protein
MTEQIVSIMNATSWQVAAVVVGLFGAIVLGRVISSINRRLREDRSMQHEENMTKLRTTKLIESKKSDDY